MFLPNEIVTVFLAESCFNLIGINNIGRGIVQGIVNLSYLHPLTPARMGAREEGKIERNKIVCLL